MSQRRIRAVPLVENNYGTNYPAPTDKVIDTTNLSGGLNLWDLDYRMSVNQSPDCENVYWKDGSLSSRPGQEYIYNPSAEGATNYGTFYACYERDWQGYIIAHKGICLYKINPSTGVHTQIYSGLTEIAGGTFFVFGDRLFYMNSREYIQITSALVATAVEGYIPVVVLGRTPAGTGGTTYQPENRIAAGKKVQFTSDGTSTEYYLPYKGLDASPTMTAVVNGTTMTEGSGFTVDRTTGVVTFSTAPSQTTVITPNNVEITCYKSDADTYNSVMRCTCATVFGGDTDLAVVCGGTPGQPNAYFWSGNTAVGLDPTYFPFDSYNYAGSDAQEYVTGFGKQQNMLVIFKEHSIGKSYFSTVTISERDYLQLPYTPINDSVGCDIEKSIKLVQNNLIFANTYGGVYVLTDTTAAGENTVSRLSRNVNGDRSSKGLLKDLNAVSATAISSYDDTQRYVLCANNHAYLWDYSLGSYKTTETKLSWFYFTNIGARGWFENDGENYCFNSVGALIHFTPEEFADFAGAISRKYTFSTQDFGTYRYLKDVMKVILAVRSDTDSEMTITYKTDYETREDLTPIRAFAWRLAPRNLAHRSLRPIPFAYSAVRKPRCFHIRHFSMTLTNNTAYTDMSIVSAQIVYRLSKEDR